MAEMEFAVRWERVVLVHDERPPTQLRWEDFCRECRRLYLHPRERRELPPMLVVSDGGGPNVLQRAQLLKAVERMPIRTAVVSSSTGVHRIHAALQLFNPSASIFELEQLLEAMNHIGINPRKYAELADSLDALCQLVPRAETARRLCGRLYGEYEREQRKLDSGIQGARPESSRTGLLRRLRRGA